MREEVYKAIELLVKCDDTITAIQQAGITACARQECVPLFAPRERGISTCR